MFDSINSVIFLLSYPYSEEYSQPTQYMNTRCPAWCDRVLMSQTALKFIHKVRHCCVYNLLGLIYDLASDRGR